MKDIYLIVTLITMLSGYSFGMGVNINELGFCNTPGSARKVAYSANNSYAFIADGSCGIRVIDCSNRNGPVEINSIVIPENTVDVAVEDTLIYVCAQMGGLRILNVSNPYNINEIGSYAIKAMKLIINNNIAYVADGDTTVYLINISDPTNPVLAGKYNTHGSVMYSYDNSNLAIKLQTLYVFVSDYVYVGYPIYSEYRSGFVEAVDVSNPEDIVLLKKTTIVGSTKSNVNPISSVCIDSNYLYLGIRNKNDIANTVKSYEIIQDSTIMFLDSLVVSGKVSDIKAMANEIVLADGYAVDNIGVVRVINTTDPKDMFCVGLYSTYPGNFSSVSANDKYLYCTLDSNITGFDSSGLRILEYVPDMTPPVVTLKDPQGSEIWQVGTTHIVKWSQSDNSALYKDSIIYSINGGTDWRFIANVFPPDSQYTWIVPNDTGSGCLIKIFAIDLARNNASDINDSYFTIINDNEPPNVSVLVPNGGEQYQGGTQYTISWLQSDNSGIQTDSVYFSPDGGSTWSPIYGGPPKTSMYYDYPYLPTQTAKVKVVAIDYGNNRFEDISDSAFTIAGDSLNIRARGACTMMRRAKCVDVRNDTAFVACDSMGLFVIDVYDPDNPKLISRVPAYNAMSIVHVSGSYVYVLDGNRFMSIGNYNDSSLAYIADSIPSIGGFDFTMSNGRAYVSDGYRTKVVACHDTGLFDTVTSVSGPYSGEQKTNATNDSFLFCPSSYDIFYSGHGYYFGYAIRKYNIINDLPVVVSTWDTSGTGMFIGTKSMVVENGYLYVCLSTSGWLRIMSIDDPNIKVWHALSCEDINVHDNLAFCARTNNWISILNVSDINSIYWTGNHQTIGPAKDIYTVGNFIYVAEDTCGLRIYEYYGPSGVQGGKDTTIQLPIKHKGYSYVSGNKLFYSIDKSGDVRIDLYNVLGQHIKVLNEGYKSVGKHSIDVVGVSSGIYFITFKKQAIYELRKMALVK